MTSMQILTILMSMSFAVAFNGPANSWYGFWLPASAHTGFTLRFKLISHDVT